MQGTISYWDQEKDDGRIQSSDGQILTFKLGSFSPDSRNSVLSAGAVVEYEVSGSEAVNIKLVAAASQDDAQDDELYALPETFRILKPEESEKGDFVVLASGAHAFHTEGRNLELMKQRIINHCKACGANSAVNYRVDKFIKNSIGFSYYLYKAEAYPAVIGRPTKHMSGVTRMEASDLLNQDYIEKYHKEEKNASRGALAMKICAVILFFIFCLGFVLTA